MKINTLLHITLTSVILMIIGCDPGFTTKKVHTIEKAKTNYVIPTITDKDKFLNDVMLSPYWKVEKTRRGSYKARARSISEDDCAFPKTESDMLLFTFIKNKLSIIPEGYTVKNGYMSGGNSYTSFSVDIIFGQPEMMTQSNLYNSQKLLKLDIFDSYNGGIGLNSYSTLIFKLSEVSDIYLQINEQGKDLNRETTFKNIQPIIDEIKRLNELSSSYYVKNNYDVFYKLRFTDISQAITLKRTPGIQDRDTFYGLIKHKKSINYNGINIMISHPIYCDGEGTRTSSRIRQAEYLGKPYNENDLLYFQIEDNAVYLSKHEYNKKFGTFSGTGSFEGEVKIMNNEETIIYKGKDQFKGWER